MMAMSGGMAGSPKRLIALGYAEGCAAKHMPRRCGKIAQSRRIRGRSRSDMAKIVFGDDHCAEIGLAVGRAPGPERRPVPYSVKSEVMLMINWAMTVRLCSSVQARDCRAERGRAAGGTQTLGSVKTEAQKKKEARLRETRALQRTKKRLGLGPAKAALQELERLCWLS
jgi:hypothetical protein